MSEPGWDVDGNMLELELENKDLRAELAECKRQLAARDALLKDIAETAEAQCRKWRLTKVVTQSAIEALNYISRMAESEVGWHELPQQPATPAPADPKE